MGPIRHSVAPSVPQALGLPSGRTGNHVGPGASCLVEEVVEVVVSVASGCEIALTGRLVVHAVADVRTLLQAAVDAGTGDLVVDVSGVELVDIIGLGVLVGADRRAKLAGRRIVLRGAGSRLLRLLRATGLHRVLTIG